MVTKEGLWNHELSRVWLSNDVIQHIKGIPPPHACEGPDKISWRYTSMAAFRWAYKILKEEA